MRWFATQVDRDFVFGTYGNGKPRLYVSETLYTSITPVSFKKGILTVKDEWGETIYIKDEPDNKWFEETVYQEWKNFDSKLDYNDENRADYEPWAYDSLESLAVELNLLNKEIPIYYKPKKSD